MPLPHEYAQRLVYGLRTVGVRPVPYALMSILYAAFNINMTRLTPEEMAEENKEFVAE